MKRKEKLVITGIFALVVLILGSYCIMTYWAGMRLGFYSGRWFYEIAFGFLILFLLLVWLFLKIHNKK